MDNLNDCSMVMVVSTTRLVAKAMNTRSSHLCTKTMTQVWDAIAVPRRRPTEILKVLSSNLRPKEELGKACNQAPGSLLITAKRLARVTSSVALSKREDAVAVH